MRCKQTQRGLTLVELLVAISVLAFVAVLGWRGLDSIVRARVALNTDLAQTRGLQLAFAQLQNDSDNLVTPSPLAGRGPISAKEGNLTLIRTVFAYNQPSQLQVISYRLKNGVLTRHQSTPTRDLAELENAWQAMTSGSDAIAGVELQSGVSAMTMRLWPRNGGGWIEDPGSNGSDQSVLSDADPNSFEARRSRAGAAAIAATSPAQWTGLEVALQLTGSESSMTKVFLLGTV